MINSRRHLACIVCAASMLVITGCATGYNTAATMAGPALQGVVHGGAQPVIGANIQLYAASTSGYGTASTSLLTVPVVTGANGSFSIANDYTCPTGSMVYVVATGGNPGIASLQTNSGLAMMAGLGPCGSIAGTKISINELTTVASVWALAPFMSSMTNVATSSTNVQGLANAFASINKIVSISAGTMPGPTLPSGASIPTTQINTLADILAACINSVDQSTSTPSANCGSLFSAAMPTGGTAPKNTIQVALNMATNPTLNLSALTNLVAATGTPYQPSMGSNVPNSWMIAINYAQAAVVTPRAIAADSSGNLWIPNSGNNTVTELSTAGAVLSGSGYGIGLLNTPSAIAIDSSGLAWVTNSGNNTVTHLNGNGTTGTNYSGGGLNVPMGIAIDFAGDVWIANSGNSTISEFASTGAAISATSGYSGGGLNQPVAVAVGSN
jgi:hypothetical protein